ncbi:MAG: formyl-CoA transferase [Deltaproteobacteria bacterium]|jgi:crotonobetainyl-CoA:carnitine CoA-transferase CaiB-like acyl-CoA transferase|nr:formyl-CoA transferase [Deltaproteobacteria bacterium]
MEAPLEGVRVIDLTRYLAGPFCTMLLGDYGADVVKVEAREGREFRPAGSPRDSYFFLSANRAKRSMTLDLRQEEGRQVLLRLLREADVLVENFRPGVMERLGVGADDLLERFPRLVYCGISGFGRTGPYRDRPGFDQIAQGMSGLMSLTGTEESGPTRSGIAISDLLAGVFASQGIQLALLARARTGRGQLVDTSLLEATLGVLTWGAGMYFERGAHPGPAGQHHPLASPYGRFRARDGFLNIAAGNDAMWGKLCEVLGHGEWREDPRFGDVGARVRNRAELTAEIDAALGEADVATWVERINAAGVPCGPVWDLEQVFSDPHVLARDMLQQLSHPEVGTFRTTGLPVKLSATPGRIERRPPLHGEHTDEVLAEAGYDTEEIAALRDAGVV